MPLPDAERRDMLQARDITCRGYRRHDGLWDIEAQLVDTRSYTYISRERGARGAGMPVHILWLRLTIDDNFEVKAVAVSIDSAPMAVCPDILPAYQALVGLRIGRGWNKTVRALLAGERGCAHLLEILGPAASTAIQTIEGYRARDVPDGSAGDDAPVAACHAIARKSQNVVFQPSAKQSAK
jgi:hypothetical protein